MHIFQADSAWLARVFSPAWVQSRPLYRPEARSWSHECLFWIWQTNMWGSISEITFVLNMHITGPGLHLADASVFISCAMSLAVFDISKELDSSGREIEPVAEYVDGTIRSGSFVVCSFRWLTYGIPSHPKPFQCTIKARSKKCMELINAANSWHLSGGEGY